MKTLSNRYFTPSIVEVNILISQIDLGSDASNGFLDMVQRFFCGVI